MGIEKAKYLKEVRNQYENYPYPRRNPEDERKKIWQPFFDSLDLINYFGFEGKKDFSKNFRALVAGGGTGDATTYLAEQLRGTGAEIMQIDMSSASIEIAKKRSEIRGLKSTSFIHNSLLELPNLDIGKFDYINCSGVLHHLANPTEGLLALKSVLKDDGVMGIMVYAEYGRTPTYFMQELMRMINKGEPNLQQQVANCKAVYYELPATNWVKRDEAAYQDEIDQSDDVGFYDLFLHTQDRAYTVPQVYDWAGECGLKLLTFLDQYGNEKALYSPAHYLKNHEVLSKIAGFPLREQQAIAEILACNFRKHSFYLSRQEKRIPDFKNRDNIPFFSSHFSQDGVYSGIYNAVANGAPSLNILNPPNQLNLKLGNLAKFIFKYFDGERSIAEIITMVKNDPQLQSANISEEKIYLEFSEIYKAFNMFDWMLLRDKSLPNTVKSANQLQRCFI